MGRPSKGPKVRRRKSGRFTVRFWLGGREYERSLRSLTMAEAEVEAREVHMSHVAGIASPAVSGELRDLTPLVPPQKPGVYAILNRTGHVKIGQSNNIARRFSQLRVGSPTEIWLMAVMSPDPTQEEWFHKLFAKVPRSHGEWFAPNREMVAAIREARRKF
jgi:hypothetical protein